MGNEFKHRQTIAGTGGDELSQAEWEATDIHEADGETTNDMLYFDGTNWIRATQATIAGLIDGEIRLDDLKATEDNTDLNASTSAHGLLLKLDNDSSNFLNGQGAWATPPGGVDTGGTPVANDIARFTDADTIEGRSYAEFKADLDLEIGTDMLAEQTIGIADDNLVEMDDASPAQANDYCKLTANGIAGRTYAEVKTDLSLNNVENTAHTTDAHTMTIDGRDVSADGTKLDNVVSNTQAITHAITDNKTVTVDGTTNVPVNGDYAKWTTNGLEGMAKAQILSDLNVADGADVTGSNAPQAHTASHTDGTDDIQDAAADDSTKGVATFEADDFDSASGKIDLATSVCKVVAGDSGTATPSTHQVIVAGTAPISTAGASATVTVSLDADGVDKTHLSQDFGASAGRLRNLIPTPIAGEILRMLSCGASPFGGVINGAPTATSVVYDGETNESMFTGLQAYDGSAYWGQIILHNTTRGNSRKIISVNTVTNEIATTSSTDDWADDDIVTCQSTTNAQSKYIDVDVSAQVPATTDAIFLFAAWGDTENNYDINRTVYFHPFEAYSTGKRQWVTSPNALDSNTFIFPLKIISQKFTMALYQGTVTVNLVTAVKAEVEYADT